MTRRRKAPTEAPPPPEQDTPEQDVRMSTEEAMRQAAELLQLAGPPRPGVAPPPYVADAPPAFQPQTGPPLEVYNEEGFGAGIYGTGTSPYPAGGAVEDSAIRFPMTPVPGADLGELTGFAPPNTVSRETRPYALLAAAGRNQVRVTVILDHPVHGPLKGRSYTFPEASGPTVKLLLQAFGVRGVDLTEEEPA